MIECITINFFSILFIRPLGFRAIQCIDVKFYLYSLHLLMIIICLILKYIIRFILGYFHVLTCYYITNHIYCTYIYNIIYIYIYIYTS